MADDTQPAARPGARRRAGRKPGLSRSRQAILDAARLAFAANGYAETSLRGIAREAGVDPSLVVHFFGSKAGVFSEVVEWPFDVEEHIPQVLAGGVDHVGERIARNFIGHWDRTEERSPIIALIEAAIADPTAAALLREFITVNFTLPLMEQIGADRPQLRAGLLASQVTGFGLGRYVLAFDGLADAPADELTAALGQILQHTCTGPL